MIEQQLRAVPLFENLSDDILEAIAARLEPEEHALGEIVFREGDPAQSMYLVASGRVDVLAGQRQDPLASLGAGSIVGELSLLLREPRSATLRVSSDAVLLALHQRDLDELLARFPAIAVELSRELGRRLVATSRRLVTPPPTRVTAVLGAGLADLVVAVAARTGSAQVGVLTLRGVPSLDALPTGVTQRDGTALGAHELAAMPGQDIEGIGHLLVALPATMTEQALTVVRTADHVVALGAVPAWAEELRSGFVLRGGGGRSLDRVARWVAGQSVGLALSSGGSKTVAHVGVLRVLREAGIDVDAVAGTSGGALVATAVALGRPDETLLALFRDLSRSLRLRDLDLNLFPRAGLIKGARMHHKISAWTGGRSFADTSIPCWMVATDVATGAEVVINQGPLADGVRASGSMPGIANPWRVGRRYCIDGAVVNPLPASVLRGVGVGYVIGSSVAGQDLDPEGLADPNMLQIMGRMLNSMEREMVNFQLPLVDTLIRPNVGPSASFDFSRVRSFIAEGEKAAREALPELLAALHELGSRGG